MADDIQERQEDAADAPAPRGPPPARADDIQEREDNAADPPAPRGPPPAFQAACALAAKVISIDDVFQITLKPIHCAAMMGRLIELKALVEEDHVPVDLRADDYMMETPMMFAAENGHVKVVKYLIDNGADINARDGWDDTVLHTACKAGQHDVVKLLLERGADASLENWPLETPVYTAIAAKNEAIVRLFPGYESYVIMREWKPLWKPL